jgi:hypothetical protein
MLDRLQIDYRGSNELEPDSIRAGAHDPRDLTAVWVPDEGSEALRDLAHAREAAKQDQMRARHRLSKFLLRSDISAATIAKE